MRSDKLVMALAYASSISELIDVIFVLKFKQCLRDTLQKI
jgi:hypothetical protein